MQNKYLFFINTFNPVIPLYRGLASHWPLEGWKPCFIQSQGNYREYQTDDTSNIIKKNTKWVWIPAFLRKNKRWCSIFYWVLAPLEIIFAKNLSGCVFLTQPPLFYILGTKIARCRKIPYVIHIMDRHPELLSGVNILKQESRLYKCLSKMSINSMKNADGIIAIGRCMKEDLIHQEIDAGKITLVSNWADDSIYPVEVKDNIFLKKHDLYNKFVVMYSGNMGLPHKFETILEVAKNLEKYDKIVFVFIGTGARRSEVEKAIAAGTDNIQLLDYQPQDLLAHSLSAASVHFISLKDGFEGIVVPSKFYGALASGRPILYEGNSRGEIARAIQEIGCGEVIEPGNSQQLYEKILYYYENSSVTIGDGNRAWNAHNTLYKQELSLEKYLNALTIYFGKATDKFSSSS
ncbi:glycosyltransferase family 4 protein [Oxynema sp. CENA135]|uniref:glycosyltransferase family 4 protein n=1 Tax=Oxynema sp. CENA135 TaxID=984206 RepID=UPI00190AA051|nr:glycosyltransferase family 4 protein [Oxynema sp. CENA135]MBK4730632.1 glycosyltransferase family 4 protein [Oxynema sp. CENA135]